MKFNWKTGKDKWIILFAAGLIILILTVPSGIGGWGKQTQENQLVSGLSLSGVPDDLTGGSDRTYEEKLERRIKQILKNVEGVGQVDVMIVLKSSEEKVYRIDREQSSSSTEEQDSGGGSRTITGLEEKESTVLIGSSGNSLPIVEKEVKPEIAGVIISAEGGGSPTVKAEISSAMEALFGVPPHKIKVLKRVK